MSPFYGIRFRKLTISREAFVKACRIPARGSALEPREQVPESVICRGNVWRLSSVRPSLRPGHVRPQPFPDPPAGRVSRRDERRGESKTPCCRFPLETPAAAPAPDQMADLVQRDEVAHLPTNGRDTNLESSLAAAVPVADADHDGAPSPRDTADAVRGAEVVDVAVEGEVLHRASVTGALGVSFPAPVKERSGCGSRRIRSMPLRRNAKVELLRRVPLFTDCSKSELGRIATLADELYQPVGTRLIEEGKRGASSSSSSRERSTSGVRVACSERWGPAISSARSLCSPTRPDRPRSLRRAPCACSSSPARRSSGSCRTRRRSDRRCCRRSRSGSPLTSRSSSSRYAER